MAPDSNPADAEDLARSSSDAPTDPSPAPARRRRPRGGRPPAMDPEDVLERIRQLAARPTTLFRIHRTHSALYARARRAFGSWQGAVIAAGISYEDVLLRARLRSLETRSQRRERIRRTID